MKIFIIIVSILLAVVSGYLLRMAYEDMIEEEVIFNIKNMLSNDSFFINHIPMYIIRKVLSAIILFIFAIILIIVFMF